MQGLMYSGGRTMMLTVKMSYVLVSGVCGLRGWRLRKGMFAESCSGSKSLHGFRKQLFEFMCWLTQILSLPLETSNFELSGLEMAL